MLGDEKGAVLKLNSPTGLFVDRNMKLYIVEMLANRVTVLQLLD